MSSKEPKKKTARPTPVRVLLVDDETELRKIMARALTDRGYIVTQAEDGVAGHQALTEHENEIDVVVTDYQMPRMNGLLLAGHAQKHYKKPVIMMSGDAQVLQAKMLEHNLEGIVVLSKPFKVDDLEAAISKISG